MKREVLDQQQFMPQSKEQCSGAFYPDLSHFPGKPNGLDCLGFVDEDEDDDNSNNNSGSGSS